MSSFEFEDGGNYFRSQYFSVKPPNPNAGRWISQSPPKLGDLEGNDQGFTDEPRSIALEAALAISNQQSAF
ncbi:MAG: hypothetical protein ACAF41_20310 [Leptolyngbya sp. BL-A-14]